MSEKCPHCGYCDKCGRANTQPFWVYPYWSVIPPYQPYYGGTNANPVRVTWNTTTGGDSTNFAA